MAKIFFGRRIKARLHWRFLRRFLRRFLLRSRRFQIARVNYWRFRGDSLNRRFEIALEIAAKIAAKIVAKIASVNEPLGGYRPGPHLLGLPSGSFS